jgi:hypothetical protein
VSLTDSLVWFGYLDDADAPACQGATGPLFLPVGTVANTAGWARMTAGNNYVSPLNPGPFNPVAWTWAGWVKAAEVPTAGQFPVLALGNLAGSKVAYALEYFHHDSILQLVVSPDGNYFSAGAVRLTLPIAAADIATPTFVAVWIAGVTIGIRVNGTSATTTITSPLYDSPGPLTLGCLLNQANNYDHDLRRWGFWSRALSAAELNSLYAGTLPVAHPGSLTTGESFTIDTPASGQAFAAYLYLGTFPAALTGANYVTWYVDAEPITNPTPAHNASRWYAVTGTLNTTAVATGTHTLTSEWTTDNTSDVEPTYLKEAAFTTSESLLRATGI